jgi:Family of unknown function (DUF5923)/Protein of unknown function (DUF4449)
VENLTLSGRNLFPNYISTEAQNYLKFSPYNALQDEQHHEFTLTFGQMQADMRDVAFYFKVKNVVVKVDTLKFSIRDSKHDFLYKTLKPLATGLVKKQIQKAIRDAIQTGMEYVDDQLVGVRDRMAEAKVNEGESRTQVLQDVSTLILTSIRWS